MTDPTRDYYAIVCTPEPDDPESQRWAKAAARRLASPERRCYLRCSDPGRVAVVPSRAYVLAAPKPWWEWARGWRP